MAFLNWRNNPILKLHRVGQERVAPNHTDWLLWVEGTKRSIGGVGVMYIYNMIEAIKWDGEETLTFLSADAMPVLIHNPLSIPYKREIVSLASKCGKTFTQVDPLVDDATVCSNYNVV